MHMRLQRTRTQNLRKTQQDVLIGTKPKKRNPRRLMKGKRISWKDYSKPVSKESLSMMDISKDRSAQSSIEETTRPRILPLSRIPKTYSKVARVSKSKSSTSTSKSKSTLSVKKANHKKYAKTKFQFGIQSGTSKRAAPKTAPKIQNSSEVQSMPKTPNTSKIQSRQSNESEESKQSKQRSGALPDTALDTRSPLTKIDNLQDIQIFKCKPTASFSALSANSTTPSIPTTSTTSLTSFTRSMLIACPECEPFRHNREIKFAGHKGRHYFKISA